MGRGRWGKLLVGLLLLAIVGGVAFYLLTIPGRVEASALPKHTPDIANGERLFYAGGCASCHAAPKDGKCDTARYEDAHQLPGGRCLATPFGTFYAPNISPDAKAGIGAWSTADFVTAMTKGVSPDGRHYYPAFPYTSYQRMRLEDLIDLKGYLDTLPAVSSTVPAHDLALPFRLRRGLGLWKLLYLDGKPTVTAASADAKVERGRYLVEGPGHCGECHTPRGPLGGLDAGRWLAGGPAPEGRGWIPNITPAKDGLADWSAGDIVSALETGMLPDGDSFGSSMVAVQENMAKLPAEDREGIAAYLKSLPAIANPRPKPAK